jgi:glycosyltransferase involved in cell wall biosynthesis
MKQPIRILLLDTNDAMGGVVRVHLGLLQALDRACIEPHLAYLPRGRVRAMFEALADTPRLRLETGTKDTGTAGATGRRAALVEAAGLVRLATAARRLARYCRRHRIQVIHTSDKKRAVLLTLLVHRLTGTPFIYHVHNAYVDYRANRWALSRAAAVLANSGAMKRDFVEALGTVMERIRVVPNGIDPQRFRPGPSAVLRRELGLGSDAVLAGIVSRLAPDKGQETFIRAAARIATVNPRAVFVIVGDDAIFSDNAAYVPMLRRRIEALGLAGRVHFTGYRENMPEVYAGLDVVVNAARREAFGMVVVEPMACGVPVIGTRAGGIPEIIQNGRNGFLFEPEDAAGLAIHLQALMGDAGLRRSVGAEARRRVLERYTIAAQARAVEAVYREIVAGENP